MSTHVFREEIVTELLLKGLKENGEHGSGDSAQLKLPERGSVPVDEVDEISESFYFSSDKAFSIAKSPSSYLVHQCIYSTNPFSKVHFMSSSLAHTPPTTRKNLSSLIHQPTS